MAFKSKAQMRKFFAMEKRGEVPQGTAHHWAHETKNIKGLPERVVMDAMERRLKRKKK